MTIVAFRDRYDFILCDNALELFDYFGVEKMHGLTRSACVKRMQEGGTYIDGLANYNPTDELGRPFVFINRAALNKDHRDVTLLMHEMVHLSLLIHNWNVGNCEEEIVTWAEEQCNVIFSSFLACL